MINVQSIEPSQINVANKRLADDIYNKEAATLELVTNDTKRVLKATEAIIKLRLLQLQELRNMRLSK